MFINFILNKSWKQHPIKLQLYDLLPLVISKAVQERQTRHAGHYCRRNDELISDVLLWTPTYGRASVDRQAKIYFYQLCGDTGCSLEDLPGVMGDRDRWRDPVNVNG